MNCVSDKCMNIFEVGNRLYAIACSGIILLFFLIVLFLIYKIVKCKCEMRMLDRQYFINRLDSICLRKEVDDQGKVKKAVLKCKKGKKEIYTFEIEREYKQD